MFLHLKYVLRIEKNTSALVNSKEPLLKKNYNIYDIIYLGIQNNHAYYMSIYVQYNSIYV